MYFLIVLAVAFYIKLFIEAAKEEKAAKMRAQR